MCVTPESFYALQFACDKSYTPTQAELFAKYISRVVSFSPKLTTRAFSHPLSRCKCGSEVFPACARMCLMCLSA